jgi:hypothetical protein
LDLQRKELVHSLNFKVCANRAQSGYSLSEG